MALLEFGKKKEETACCCAGASGVDCVCGDAVSSVKVLGAGCKACHQQMEYAKAAVKELGLSVEVEYITDMEQVMAYGVMSMPAIVINGQVAAYGRVLKTEDVKKLLGGQLR